MRRHRTLICIAVEMADVSSAYATPCDPVLAARRAKGSVLMQPEPGPGRGTCCFPPRSGDQGHPCHWLETNDYGCFLVRVGHSRPGAHYADWFCGRGWIRLQTGPVRRNHRAIRWNIAKPRRSVVLPAGSRNRGWQQRFFARQPLDSERQKQQKFTSCAVEVLQTLKSQNRRLSA
jgi:hypothetical protein